MPNQSIIERSCILYPKVVAVVVTYYPCEKDFALLIDALLPQVQFAVIVDNSSCIGISDILSFSTFKNFEVLNMSENMGIAAAQNIGIQRAIDLGAGYVLLSDQDSVPSHGMVSELVAALQVEESSKSIAAVGPAIVDKRTNITSYFIIERFGFPFKWKPAVAETENLPFRLGVGFLIASGTLIPVEVLKHIGIMRSDYFIDHVDTEWCFRAKAVGYRLIGVPNARLTHQLGDKVKRVWFFGFRQVMYHSPLRDYYMFRNTLLMLRDTKMSLIWQLHFLWRLVQFVVYFLIFSGDRYKRIKLMLLGIKHGLLNVRGRFDEESKQCVPLPVIYLETVKNLWGVTNYRLNK